MGFWGFGVEVVAPGLARGRRGCEPLRRDDAVLLVDPYDGGRELALESGGTAIVRCLLGDGAIHAGHCTVTIAVRVDTVASSDATVASSDATLVI